MLDNGVTCFSAHCVSQSRGWGYAECFGSGVPTAAFIRSPYHGRFSQEELAVAKKGDERKAAIAAIIRARTTALTPGSAQSLHLGHVSRVSHCIRRAASRADLRRALENCLEQ